MKLVECKHCGWVHFPVSRTYAEDQVAQFNAYYDTLSKKKQQENYGGRGASIASYEHCFSCNKPADMVLTKRHMMGHTIQPIIWNEEV